MFQIWYVLQIENIEKSCFVLFWGLGVICSHVSPRVVQPKRSRGGVIDSELC